MYNSGSILFGGSLIPFSFDACSGVANEALKQGIPAIAFSGAGGTQHSFTEPDPVADLYAQVALKVIQAVTASKPFLPTGTALVGVIAPSLHTTFESNIHDCVCAECQFTQLGRYDLHKALRLLLRPLPREPRRHPINTRRRPVRYHSPPYRVESHRLWQLPCVHLRVQGLQARRER